MSMTKGNITYNSVHIDMYLSNPFNTTYYRSAGIAWSSVTNGSDYPPSGVISSQSAPTTNSSSTVGFNVNGLSPSTTYTIYGYASVASNGKYYSSGSVTFTTDAEITPIYPSNPGNPLATHRFNNGGAFGWAASTNASYYELKITSNNGSYSYNKTYTTSVNSRSVYDMDGGVNYTLAVRAVSSTGHYSSWITTSSYTTKCNDPTVSFSNNTSSSITWNLNTADNYDYMYVRCEHVVGGIAIDTWYKTVSSNGNVTFDELEANEEHAIYVYSYLSGVSACDSNIVVDSVYTQSSPIPDVPSAPLVSSRGTSTLGVYWTAVGDADYYILNVYDDATSGSIYNKVKQPLWNTSTTWGNGDGTYSQEDTPLTPATTYKLRIKAYNNSGTSAYSSASTITTKPSTPSLSISTTTDTSITVTVTGYGNYDSLNVNMEDASGNLLSGQSRASSGDLTFTSLSPTITYYFRAYAIFNTVQSNEVIISDTTTTPIPDTPSGLIVTNRTQTSLSLSWNNVIYASEYLLWIIDDDTDGSLYNQIHPTTSTSLTVSGLSPSTKYETRISAKNIDDEMSNFSSAVYTQTTPYAPSIVLGENLYNSIEFTVGQIGNYDSINVYLDDVLLFTTFSTGTFTRDGLTENTLYSLSAETVYNGDTSTRTSINFTTPANPRPSNWTWSTNFTSTFNTVKVNSTTYNSYIMPSSEWNNFTQRINEFRIYKNLTNYTFTTVSSGTTFTSTIMNQAINAINDLGYGISTVSSGSDVSSSKFDTMAYYLNIII